MNTTTSGSMFHDAWRGMCLLLGVVVMSTQLPTGSLVAQEKRQPNLTLSAGIAEYDLSGTGTTGVGALALSLPLTSFLTIDPTLGFLRYEPQFGSHVSFLMPELSARVQVPGRTINPFLALGAGLATVVEGNGETDLTAHAAIGTYVWLNKSWGLRPEARLRGIDPFVGTTAELTFGVSRRL